jgi:predicted dienelactone hydrolase
MRIAVLAIVLVAALARAETDYTERGPFEVGTTTVDIAKTSVTTGAPRVLRTLVWYPAVAGTETTGGTGQGEPDVAKGRFPFVVFSHGSCGIPQQSPFLMEALASRGFVVAAPPHPGNTILDVDCMSPASEADSYANRPADVAAVIDTFLGFDRDPTSQFHRRLNRARIAVSGHSFGGQTTLRVAASDRRIRAALALAPSLVKGPRTVIRPPLMVMTGEVDSLTPLEADARPNYALGRGPRYLVEILNAGHCAFIPICPEVFCGAGCDPGNLAPADANHLVLRYAVPFMLRYLKGDRAAGRVLRPADAPAGVVVEASRGRGH